MSGTARTMTVLFTDMVGSTARIADLGPREGSALLTRHFAGLRSALAVHRGTEVKSLGDGIMAVFESAGDALAAAATMQRSVADHGRALGRPVGMRVGISAGEVIDEGGDYSGMPVVESSRLCAVADAGQIIAADVVRALVGAGADHRLDPVGPIELKGVPAAVTAWALDWDDDEDTALRVALADDAALLRAGLCSLLEVEGMQVVLQVSEADALLAGLEAARPNVIVLDMRMPPTYTTEGLWAAEAIRARWPEMGVLVLSASVEPNVARRLLRDHVGGIGYLLKERVADPEQFVAAIRTVAGGGRVLDPEVQAGLAG